MPAQSSLGLADLEIFADRPRPLDPARGIVVLLVRAILHSSRPERGTFAHWRAAPVAAHACGALSRNASLRLCQVGDTPAMLSQLRSDPGSMESSPPVPNHSMATRWRRVDTLVPSDWVT